MDDITLEPRVVAMLERNLQAIIDGAQPESLPPHDIGELYALLLGLEHRLRQGREALTDRLFEAAAAARRRRCR